MCHAHPDQDQSHKQGVYREEQCREQHKHSRAQVSAEKHHCSYPATSFFMRKEKEDRVSKYHELSFLGTPQRIM